MAVAAQIVTPYQLHHGDADPVVQLQHDQALADILEASGVEHELHVYAGYNHEQITDDPTMFGRVRGWYTTYGVLAE
jgi:predicted esterase